MGSFLFVGALAFASIHSVPSDLPGNWTSVGCYTDVAGVRTLSASTYTDTKNMTVGNCISFCENQDYIYAGVEFSQECYCGNTINIDDTNATATDCNMPCTGNALETCGAGGRLNLFWSGATPPPPPVTSPKVGDWTSIGCFSDNVNGAGRSLPVGADLAGPATIRTCTAACFASGYQFAGAEFAAELRIGSSGNFFPRACIDCSMVCAGNSSEFCGGPNRLTVYNYTGTDLPPITNPGGGGGGAGAAPVVNVYDGLPGTWNYSACYIDNAHGRIFENAIGPNATTTVESCVNSCIAGNYSVAGIEFGVNCGNRLINGAEPAIENTCNMGCGGNSTEACGGPNRLSVYSSSKNITVLPVPTVLNDTNILPKNWTYAGCYTDENNGRVLPWQIIWEHNATVEACVNQCSTFGYTAASLEYGQECYCGDISDIQANGATLAPETDCSFQCSGDPIHLCGGGLRMTTYFFNGVKNVWHTPAVTVPLIATVGLNNKVTFLEKDGTGFPNSTGAYELDLSLTHDFDHAWREMHVKSDVFCSASIILPDKAGRQINVGGWSLQSTYGIRLYTPNGVEGVNSTNDWEEDYNTLKLQRGRWYPTAAMLPNGSILVVGGETGSNAPAEPSLEILPRPPGGDTYLNMDWLQRTDPNNLYPFIFVLPGGGIFIAYYNEARILDAATFDTIKSLPNAPAAVDNFDGGRTYPLEGVAMSLPQHAPYTDPLEILICGGSTPGPGFALDNCVTIAPEVENPTWTIERMPSRRVMPCMAALPDGTFLLLNGAHQGVAGFGLATDPALTALLYDPALPLGQRMSILNTTIVARLYHSEATLLPDGRVLVSGSDPQDGKNPEEFRIEVYVPPYLETGLTQPSYSLPKNDWAYGGTYQITNVTLHQGSAATMRVSLIAATSSTHGNAMGSRTIFPQFSCSGRTCTITAPPNANISPPGWHQLFILDGPTPSHSQWVRIGGDPGELGNWPSTGPFTVPGV
ncbi:copper radical oxidase with WSC domains [Hymenopellis radicata]|nr:copper radical oxidase with WSC domains [Hymenopellis radicata]